MERKKKKQKSATITPSEAIALQPKYIVVYEIQLEL